MYLNDFKCVNNVSNTFHKEDLRFARSSSASAPGRRPAINDARAMAEAVQPPRTVQPRCGTVQRWSSWHFQSFSVAGFHWTIIEPSLNQMLLLEVFQSDKHVGLYQVIFLDHHSQNWPSRIHFHCRSNAVKRCHSPPRNMSKITLTPANPWQTHVRGKKSIEKFLFGCSFQANTEKPFPISPWHTKFAGCQHSFLQYKQLLEQSCFRKGDPSMIRCLLFKIGPDGHAMVGFLSAMCFICASSVLHEFSCRNRQNGGFLSHVLLFVIQHLVRFHAVHACGRILPIKALDPRNRRGTHKMHISTSRRSRNRKWAKTLYKKYNIYNMYIYIIIYN